MLEIGSLIDGKYKILNKVGQGGMSVVYLAMNEKANKQWAVKEVRKDGIKDFEVVKQGLVAETDILKKLSHPSLPSIIDVIDTRDSFIIIMDYIQGNSLNKSLEEYGAQPQDHVIEWAKQLCDVLNYLHSRTPPIIYRDMKPANIMLKPDGSITLIDFGTAREFKEKNLADTTCLGTIGYAAPEQFGGMGQTDARTDIYCLGATLYHLVTGMNPCEPPYEIKPIREINPALSSGFEKIILKCTQRDPNDRYQSAAELMYALENYEVADDKYRKTQKKKLYKFVGSLVLSAAFAITALFANAKAEQVKGDNYDYAFGSAETLQELGDVILIDPSRSEAYNKIVYLIDGDDVLADDEATFLKKLRVGLDSKGRFTEHINVLESLKESAPADYYEFCYQIGGSFLYNYEAVDNLSRYETANWWYNEARNEYHEAGIYCDIYDCLNRIKKASNKGGGGETESKAYKDFWDKLKALGENIEKSTLEKAKGKMITEICLLVDEHHAKIVASLDPNIGVATNEIISELEKYRNIAIDLSEYEEEKKAELMDALNNCINKTRNLANKNASE